MRLILQWFREGSLGVSHNLLGMYLRTERASRLDHGYAMSHSSQGQIADRVLIHVHTEVSLCFCVACMQRRTTPHKRPRNAQYRPRKRCSH